MNCYIENIKKDGINKISGKKSIKVSDVKKALINKEFQMYFQPQVNSCGKIIGVEVLARWFSPKYGNVPPDVFIPILEKNNLIYAFQNDVFINSYKKIYCLNKMINTNMKLSINISPKQFENDNFINDIEKIISENNIDSNMIEFEITESYPINEIKDIKTKLDMLKKMNINVALDDFGTGYNSIKYLSEFSFDVVKIDKGYINKLEDKPKFISSMINMVHSVESKVVAEGVEEEYQLDILRKLGVNIMQGYFFYKPMKFEDLIDVIKKDISKQFEDKKIINIDKLNRGAYIG